MLEARDLVKSFGSVMAVNHVSLTVASGEVVALIGPNGAGKSTLLGMIAGLLIPDAGSAWIAGQPATLADGAARKQLGFVSGDTALYGKLKVGETLRFFGSLYGLDAKTLQMRVQQVAEELRIDGLLDRRTDALSMGQRQRVNLARALVHDPAVLILDEPTNALDVASQQFVLDAVLLAKSRGRAVLFSSHIMGEVERVADRVVLLQGGQIRAEGALSSLLAQVGSAGLGSLFIDPTLKAV